MVEMLDEVEIDRLGVLKLRAMSPGGGVLDGFEPEGALQALGVGVLANERNIHDATVHVVGGRDRQLQGGRDILPFNGVLEGTCWANSGGNRQPGSDRHRYTRKALPSVGVGSEEISGISGGPAIVSNGPIATTELPWGTVAIRTTVIGVKISSVAVSAPGVGAMLVGQSHMPFSACRRLPLFGPSGGVGHLDIVLHAGQKHRAAAIAAVRHQRFDRCESYRFIDLVDQQFETTGAVRHGDQVPADARPGTDQTGQGTQYFRRFRGFRVSRGHGLFVTCVRSGHDCTFPMVIKSEDVIIGS